MRPRHKAAENAPQSVLCDRVVGASMRPRHKAAENPLIQLVINTSVRKASMRPRHKAAENGHHQRR